MRNETRIWRVLALHTAELCHYLLPSGTISGSEYIIGSVLGEPGQSMKVCLEGPKAGLWFDFATSEGGDIVALIAANRRISRHEALSWGAQWLRDRPVVSEKTSIAAPANKPQLDWRQIMDRALEILEQSQSASGTLVEHYLAKRGLSCTLPNTIRFHPDLWCQETGGHFPAMIAKVTDELDRFVAIHRTYLAKDGSGKAPVEDAKKALGPIAGGAVRLAAAVSSVGICEGIENGLAVAQTYPDLPVWAALSTSGVKRVVLPPSIRQVVILVDGDDPSERAASALANRLIREGRTVDIARPPRGHDFNELLNK